MIESSNTSFILRQQKLNGFAKFHRMIASQYNCRRKMLLMFFDEQTHSCKSSEVSCDVCCFMPSFFKHDVSKETGLVLSFLFDHAVSEDVLMKVLHGQYQRYQMDSCLDVIGILKDWSKASIYDYINFLITSSLIESIYTMSDGTPVMTLAISVNGKRFLTCADFMRPLLMSLPTEANYLLRKDVISRDSFNNWRSHCPRLIFR